MGGKKVEKEERCKVATKLSFCPSERRKKGKRRLRRGKRTLTFVFEKKESIAREDSKSSPSSPPSAHRFGSLRRFECEPSVLWSTPSQREVSFGARKKEKKRANAFLVFFFVLRTKRRRRRVQKKLPQNSLSNLFSYFSRSPPHGLSRWRWRRRKQPTESTAFAAAAAFAALVRGPLSSEGPRCRCRSSSTTTAPPARHQQPARHARRPAPGPRSGPVLRSPDRHAAARSEGAPREGGRAPRRGRDGERRRRRRGQGALLLAGGSSSCFEPAEGGSSSSGSSASKAERHHLHQPEAVPPDPRAARGEGARGGQGRRRAGDQGRVPARVEARGGGEEASSGREVSAEERACGWRWWKRRWWRRRRELREREM
jgi:hypothetical protein